MSVDDPAAAKVAPLSLAIHPTRLPSFEQPPSSSCCAVRQRLRFEIIRHPQHPPNLDPLGEVYGVLSNSASAYRHRPGCAASVATFCQRIAVGEGVPALTPPFARVVQSFRPPPQSAPFSNPQDPISPLLSSDPTPLPRQAWSVCH